MGTRGGGVKVTDVKVIKQRIQDNFIFHFLILSLKIAEFAVKPLNCSKVQDNASFIILHAGRKLG